MSQFLTINVNMTRNGVKRGDAGFQRSEARKCVKLLLVPPSCLTFSMIETLRFAMSPLALNTRVREIPANRATKGLQASFEIFYVK